ncbi:HEAT repeat domain-containing protein [Pendulispora rubella]|uniref:HEAT repeat domain-containing protein n=1 Tax=Pendulispora rubella TaxID=2741070 RepID=A0ABZ2LM05_9BACT
MRRPWTLACAVVGIVATAQGIAGGARAAEPPPAPPKIAPSNASPPGPLAPRKPLPAGTAEKLKSGEPERIAAALEDARLAGKGATSLAGEIAGLLDRGLNGALAESALNALAEIESPASTPSVAAYLQHRDAKVRTAAAKALARTKGPAAVAALRHALADSEAPVRSAAATSLGVLRAREAVGDLALALDHRVVEAAAPIGQLCNADECADFLARLGRLPLDLVESGLEPMLFRPVAEVNEDTKANVIGRVRELKTNEAHKFLLGIQKRWPATGSPRLKTLIEQAVKATTRASGS